MTSQAITYAGFALLLLLAIALEISVRRSADRPSLGALLTRHRLVQVAALLFWAFVGWHLFVRGSGAFE